MTVVDKCASQEGGEVVGRWLVEKKKTNGRGNEIQKITVTFRLHSILLGSLKKMHEWSVLLNSQIILVPKAFSHTFKIDNSVNPSLQYDASPPPTCLYQWMKTLGKSFLTPV